MRKFIAVIVGLLFLSSHALASGFLINSYRYAGGGGGCVSPSLTISDLGNATSTSSGATLVTGSTITASVGDWLVAIVAGDNQGTSGAASLTGVQDSSSNTWTQRVLLTHSPTSAAADGATIGIFTAPITSAPSSGTVTANFSPNTTAKAIQVYRVQPSGGCSVSFIAADTTGTTATAATAISAATVSVTNGDTIFGAAARESNNTPTGDSDTTNGSWSTIINRLASTGVAATSMDCDSQYKTVNATGNQSWDITWSGTRDAVASYLILRPN